MWRADSHHGGKDVRHIMCDGDLEALPAGGYFVRYIPKLAEFRVHVCGNEAVAWVRKKPKEVDSITGNADIAAQHEWKNRVTRMAFGNWP